MESYTSHHRPITPPHERKSLLQQQQQQQQEQDKDISFLDKEIASSFPPVSTAPSAPPAPATSINPFKDQTSPNTSILSDTPNRHQTFEQHGQRNETTQRIENEVRQILKWKNPVRSGLILGLIVSSILLTRWYSLLQIGSSAICLATAINLIYVNFILQSKKIVTNQDVSHPYSDVINDESRTMVNRNSVRHYSNVMTDLSETVVRALTRIVFVENTRTSVKWTVIFFIIWKVSAVVSTMNIVLFTVISAFIFPRLYISNKDLVDAHIQKGQTMIQSSIDKAQHAAVDAVQNSYSKSRAFVAKVGTTGTDAKNTLSKTSATLKEE